MFPKLLLIILVAGATASALLVNRQQRIDTAHDIADLHHRLHSQEQLLWRLKGDLAQHCRPQRIRQHLDTVGGSWVAIPDQPPSPTTPSIRIAIVPDPIVDPTQEDMGG